MKAIVVTVLLGLAATVSANSDMESSEPAVAIERWDSMEPFNLDGMLDEDFWQSATNLSDFKQVAPFLGESPTEETEVLLSYDDDFLYIGARLYQSNPDAIFASVLERDQDLNADDFFEVIIDSYNDKTNALGFRTNLLGTRVDYEVSNNGVTINQAWNTFWDVRTTRTDSGWNAEFQIPLASLRYVPAQENTMGFKFIRRIKSKSEMLLYPMKDQSLTGLEYHLQNTAEIALASLGKKRPLFITPYSAGSVTQAANLNRDGTAYVSETQAYRGKDYTRRDWMDRLLSNNGFDIKYRLNNSHTLDLTVNTDFAQAEADDRIVNLTRYSIALPEKRAFFLENADLLSASMFHHVFFHSRNIGIESDEQVPLVAGARLTGTTGGFQYGLLNIQSKELPASEIPARNFGVARVKRNLSGDDSYIGGIFTSVISGAASHSNRLIAADGLYRITDQLVANYFLASTSDDGSSGNDHYAFGVSISRFPANGYEFYYHYREYQEDFSPGAGFLSRPDTRQVIIRNGYKRTFRSHPWLSRIVFGQYATQYWLSSTGRREYSSMNLYLAIYPVNGARIVVLGPIYTEDNLTEPWEFSEKSTIPAGHYRMNQLEVQFESGKKERYQYSGWSQLSDYYGGKRFTLCTVFNYIVNEHLNFELSADYNRLRFPGSYSLDGNQIEVRSIYYGKLNLTFTSKLSLKTLLQYDKNVESMAANIRLRYNPAEGRDLYIVYNQDLNTNPDSFEPVKPRIQSQALIVKYSHTFLF